MRGYKEIRGQQLWEQQLLPHHVVALLCVHWINNFRFPDSHFRSALNVVHPNSKFG